MPPFYRDFYVKKEKTMLIFDRIKKETDAEFDAVMLVSPINRRYATGFKSSAGYVFATPDKTVFFTDFRYYGSALSAQSCGRMETDAEIRILDGSLWDNVGELMKAYGKILIEESYLTLSHAESLKEKMPGKVFVHGASAALNKLRSVKTEAELGKIISAQKITDKAFAHIVPFISDNLGKLTESDVALELEYFMRKNGADGIAFDTIAVSGTKSAMPHGVPTDIKLQKGFLTMDFGAMFDGYCSDMTRTICIGKPTDKMKLVYDTVLSAQLAALDAISADKTGKEIDGIAREIIDKAGFEGCFGHSLGHSLGLEIHESPNFSSGNGEKVPCGAVLSVEPGIYIDGEFGVRIEDIVNITEKGCRNLTKSVKDLIIL